MNGSSPKYAVTPQQMKFAEQYSERHGTSCAALMENVGKGIADGTEVCGGRVLILCGRGNNGGDGFAAAKYLAGKSSVTVALVSGEPDTELAKQCFERCRPYFSVTDCDGAAKILAANDADVIIDCVYGTGFHGELPENIAKLFALCNSSRALRISADIASGCNALNGEACDGAFCADVTFCAGAIKLGQLIRPASRLSGSLKIIDAGFPAIPNYTAQLSGEHLLDLIPKRQRISHKGDHGRFLNVAGCEKYPGAAWLSCNAAMRTGAGIVTLASVKEVVSAVAASLHECTFLPLKNGCGYIDAEDIKDILKEAKAADAIAAGCGMGASEDTRLVVRALAENAECPVIIDADGINSLAGHIHLLKNNGSGLLLTPHPKEFSRISGLSVGEILKDPFGTASSFAQEYGVYLLLKDAYSVIASPDGRLAVNLSGNAALAKGGSGDCLTGTVGGLLAQGMDPYDALRAGAYIAGLAAEKAALTRSMSSILPGELAQLYSEILP